jgi:hypothetical protein
MSTLFPNRVILRLHRKIGIQPSWVSITFPDINKHKKGKENVIGDALSRRYTMLSQLDHKFFALESIKELYATDIDFKDAYGNCREGRT